MERSPRRGPWRLGHKSQASEGVSKSRCAANGYYRLYRVCAAGHDPTAHTMDYFLTLFRRSKPSRPLSPTVDPVVWIWIRVVRTGLTWQLGGPANISKVSLVGGGSRAASNPAVLSGRNEVGNRPITPRIAPLHAHWFS